jgi:hypothetical protein
MAARLVTPPAYLIIDLPERTSAFVADQGNGGQYLRIDGTTYAVRALLLDALAQLPAVSE